MSQHHRHNLLPAGCRSFDAAEILFREHGNASFLHQEQSGRHRDHGVYHPNPLAWMDTDGSLFRSGYGEAPYVDREQDYHLPPILVKHGDTWTREESGLLVPSV